MLYMHREQIHLGMHLHTRHPSLILWVWHFRWQHKYIPSSRSCTTTLQRYIPFWKESTVVVHESTWGLVNFVFVALFLFLCASHSWSLSTTSCSQSWRRRSSWMLATWTWDSLLTLAYCFMSLCTVTELSPNSAAFSSLFQFYGTCTVWFSLSTHIVSIYSSSKQPFSAHSLW